jgi:hypothetical protein
MGAEKTDSMYPILKQSNTNTPLIHSHTRTIRKTIERDFHPKTLLISCNNFFNLEQYKTRLSGTPRFRANRLYGENSFWSGAGDLN